MKAFLHRWRMRRYERQIADILSHPGYPALREGMERFGRACALMGEGRR